MKRKITVNIVREDEKVTVTNNQGMKWVFLSVRDPYYDLSTAGAIANIAASLLCGTIISQLIHSNEHHISYTLEVNDSR